jgi:hypothetical protein
MGMQSVECVSNISYCKHFVQQTQKTEVRRYKLTDWFLQITVEISNMSILVIFSGPYSLPELTKIWPWILNQPVFIWNKT